MNLSETKGILAVLRAAYPQFYSGMGRDELYAIVNLWQRQFSADNGNEVMAAVEALIATRTNTYPPVIGEIKEKLQCLRETDGLTEQEAWSMVSKACKNGIYGYRKEWDKLPPEVQDTIGRPEQLREWAMCETDEFETVVASNFMRSFKVHAKRKRESAMLPKSVRTVVAQIGNGMKMEEMSANND